VSIGTDSYGAYSMTALTVQKSRKKTSEDSRIMIFCRDWLRILAR
jgi:hypothetical protein